MFDFLKRGKKNPAPAKTWRDEEYEHIDKKKKAVGEYPQSKHFRGFKRCSISSARYPEAEKNLKTLITSRRVIPSNNKYGGESVDLSESVKNIYLSKLKDGNDIIMVYGDGLFIGSNIPGTEGKSAAILNALKKHNVTEAHVVICFGDHPVDKSLVFDNYLIVNGVES